jgi:GT2 family glycosyltransferase
VDDAPAISIIVVAYRQREALLECIQACLDAATHVSDGAELIVVDNGGLALLVHERFPAVRLVEPGFNAGFAGGVVRGLAVARGTWIALVNDDARIEPDALVQLLNAGRRSSEIGSVAAQVRFAYVPQQVNSAGICVDALGIATERLAGAPASAAADVAEVFGATGCFALYRREMLAEIGGFDQRFFAYLEDVDLAWRARAGGWICVYEPRALAYHRGSATSRHGSASKYYLVGRNRVWLLARNATTGQLLRALPGIALYDCAYIVYVALSDRTLAPLRGRLAGMRSWLRLRRETRSQRREVPLASGGWRAALRQHRAYRDLASAD